MEDFTIRDLNYRRLGVNLILLTAHLRNVLNCLVPTDSILLEPIYFFYSRENHHRKNLLDRVRYRFETERVKRDIEDVG